MSLAIIHSRASVGVEAPEVTVEVHISNGMPGFSLVGLAETTVKEAKDRVRSAIINSNFEFPSKRITVNLAPADLPKDGGRFDLPLLWGFLLPLNRSRYLILAIRSFLASWRFLVNLGALKACCLQRLLPQKSSVP
ncbi:Mg(2+) chelatase family protein [Vibrio astriarenae]|nr:Mg(2+) chelatase family protein [Vibrio sp. C7]